MVSRVTLMYPPNAVLDADNSTFICVTSASKPQACVRAYIRTSANIRELDPGYCNQDSTSVQTTTRTFTFTATAEENGAELYCNASNSVTDLPVQSQVHTLNVQYPPRSGILLSGYVNNTAAESGETLTLTCQVGKGNPRPVLTWSSVCGQTNTVPGNDGSQKMSISITVRPSLNQKTCVCKGSQSGALTRWTEQKSRTFNVMFGPDSLQLRADSGQSGNTVTVIENSTVTFTCISGESNPAAVLSWFNNNSPIATAEISDLSLQQGSNHGYLTTQRYTVRVDRYQDDDIIRCEAQRPGNGQSKPESTNLTMAVFYAPEIKCNSTHVTLFEGQRLKMSCDVTSNDNVVINWYEKGRRIDNAVMTNSRGPTRRDVIISTLEFDSAEATLTGVCQIEAKNSVGSSTREITISVIEGQFIPKELLLTSCINSQTSLVWASAIDDSFVKYYNLEYKANGEDWKKELVRNPGRVKLVRKTLKDLQSGLLYQFRLQPVSDISLSEYAAANCTIQDGQPLRGQNDVPAAGLRKGDMFGIGVVVGVAVVTVIAVSVICWLRRKTPSTEGTPDKQETGQVKRAVEDRRTGERAVKDTTYLESSGHYEDLDTTPNPARPHYEELSGRTSSSTPGENRIYENATVF
ncbi:uncharacterized protein LOC135462605 [Liolophura sinensis]|uniref:uncharacterized protein LOC135462605 n=1 Tax=Liolophura sinensis TaxID=3198878 RepID=UPI003158D08B